MKKHFLTFALLISCGSYDDDDGNGSIPQQEQASKSIFDRWTRPDGFFFDLSNGQFDFPFDFAIFSRAGDALCECRMIVTGTEALGNMDIFNCSWTGRGRDPGCFEFENDGRPFTYKKTTPQSLEICNSPSECAIFQ